jgi:hypothetical protein
MVGFKLLSLLSAAYLCAATSAASQAPIQRVGVQRAQQSFTSQTHPIHLSPVASIASSRRSNRSLVWSGLAIGAGSGALLGGLWGRYVDNQQICPNAGPCGGRGNVGPYALTGAAVGGVLGAAVGWLARNR